MRIDDLIFRVFQRQKQEALDAGEQPPADPPPITFDTVQELIQKGELTTAEASLLDALLEQIGETPSLDASPGAAQARVGREAQIAQARGQLLQYREQLTRSTTPDSQLREYAPGEPVEPKTGPKLPLHGALMGQEIAKPGGGE